VNTLKIDRSSAQRFDFPPKTLVARAQACAGNAARAAIGGALAAVARRHCVPEDGELRSSGPTPPIWEQNDLSNGFLVDGPQIGNRFESRKT